MARRNPLFTIMNCDHICDNIFNHIGYTRAQLLDARDLLLSRGDVQRGWEAQVLKQVFFALGRLEAIESHAESLTMLANGPGPSKSKTGKGKAAQ
jgi:hypothetical protein